MKRTLFLIVVMALCTLNYAQKDYIKINKKYPTARIYKKDYKIIKVTSLELTNDTLVTFKKVNSQKAEQLSVKDIKYFSVRKGSKALSYGLIGAGIGLFSVGITHLSYSSEPLLDDYNWTPMYAGSTVGCGVIGAIIGAFSPKWKRLYIQGKNSSYSLLIYPGLQRNYYNLSLSINF